MWHLTKTIKNECAKIHFHKVFHCAKSVHIWSYSCSGPHFPAFRLNTERYRVPLRIQSECGKMWTRITSNTDTFYAVSLMVATLDLLSKKLQLCHLENLKYPLLIRNNRMFMLKLWELIMEKIKKVPLINICRIKN